MKVKCVELGLIKENCYLIESETAAIVVDPGVDSQIVDKFIHENSNKECMILLTHAHFDHICGAPKLREEYYVKIAIGKNDAEGLMDTELSLSDKFHAHQVPFKADTLLSDGETLTVGDFKITAIETPGHTIGGVCYLINGVLFSGDTLFLENVGNTVSRGSSFEDLTNSVRKIAELDENTVVYPGHGETTTIKHEKAFNPYLMR